jgi:hypothetical protein
MGVTVVAAVAGGVAVVASLGRLVVAVAPGVVVALGAVVVAVAPGCSVVVVVVRGIKLPLLAWLDGPKEYPGY